MSEFQYLLLFSYIEEVDVNFSYSEFATRIGTSVRNVEEMIDIAISEKKVRCDKQGVFYKLTALGKDKLLKSGVIYYHFKPFEVGVNEPEKWPLDKPYVPKDFLKKLL
ncbi:MAG: hypothetical protein ABFC56_00120 [Clostridiaceae bacterium]